MSAPRGRMVLRPNVTQKKDIFMRKAHLGASAIAGMLASATAMAAPAGTCPLLNGPIKHIVYLQFDNTHFTRDVPNDILG